jgi:hypothetical protein
MVGTIGDSTMKARITTASLLLGSASASGAPS